MPDETGATQKLSPRTKKMILLSPWVGFVVFVVYGLFENFSPSEFVIQYAPFAWVLLGLGYLIFMFTNRQNTVFNKEASGLKWAICAIIWSVICLYLIKTTTIYGVPTLINKIVGEPFQAQAMVTRKYWNTTIGPRLHLANFEGSADGNVGSGKTVWNEVNKGDIVTVSGVQSILGQSIDTVIKPQLQAPQTTPLASETEMAPPNPTSAAQASSQDPSTDKILLRAIEKGDYGLVELFLRQGADVDARRAIPSAFSADQVRHLDSSHTYAKKGTTPLEYAAMKGNIEIVKLLMRKGANVHLKDAAGDTPFFAACAFGHLDIAELLAEKGAKIDEPNIYGTTPLIIASLTGRTAVVKFLLDKGANINTRDGLGNTPLLAAKKKALKPQPEIVKFLEERGAKE